MAFDVSQGLSEAGKSIATTTGAAILEAQKGDLEMQKVKLADELAGVREEKHRGFLTSERLSTQAFTGGENEKTRTNQKDVATIGAEGHKAAAGISAGASLTAAREHIEAQLKMAGDIKIGDDGTSSIVNKVTGVVKPILGVDGKPAKFKDPDMAKAQLEAVRVTSVQLGDLQRKYQTDSAGPRQLLLQVQKDPMLMGPEKQAAIARAEAEVRAVEERYKPEFTRLNARMDGLSAGLIEKSNIGAVPGGSGVIRYDAQGNRITDAPSAVTPNVQGIGSAPTGMINTGGL